MVASAEVKTTHPVYINATADATMQNSPANIIMLSRRPPSFRLIARKVRMTATLLLTLVANWVVQQRYRSSAA